MPEDNENAASAAVPSAGLLSGLRGWIIVGGVVVLNWAFFILYIHFGRAPVEGDPNAQTPAVSPLAEDPTRVVSVKPLIYSTQMGAPAMQVSMEVTLVFGWTEEEKRNPKAPSVPKPAILDEYKAYGEASVDYLKNRLTAYMAGIEGSALRGAPGLERLREEIKTYMNQRMQEYLPKGAPADMDRNRVTDVLIPQLIVEPKE